MTKATAAPATALLTLLTLPLALDAGPLPRPQLSFEKNLGQTHESVDFTARGRRYAATLHAGSYSLALRTGGGGKPPRWTLSPLERFARPPSTPWVISMYLAGANSEAAAEGLEPLAARSHYLRGKDPSEWLTDVPHYGRVRYQDVYPGIDIEYYGNSGAMEFDFLIQPGADPGRIRMDFGAVSVEIDDDGDLVFRKGEHELRHRKPAVYQTLAAQRAEIEGRYNLEEDGTVTFRLSDYDAGLTVVIDPLIDWQETIGGSGDDRFNSVAIGPDGTIHVAGTTESSDIPTQGGWGKQPPGGPSDAYVATFRPDGGLISATYLGGSGRDVNEDIAVDRNGVRYVIGTTNSLNYPTTDGAFQRMYGGGPADAVVTILSPDGSELVGSTYLGGPSLDLGTGIALDNQGVNALSVDELVQLVLRPGDPGFIATGTTFGVFPVTPEALQPDNMGEGDVFVSWIDRLARSLYSSTLFGGSGLDFAVDIVVDDDGGPHILIETNSPNLFTTDDAFQPQLGGWFDAFLLGLPALFDDPGAEEGFDRIGYASYLGEPGDEGVGGTAAELFRYFWFGGRTTGGLPTTSNAPKPDYPGGPTAGFLVRLSYRDQLRGVPLDFDLYTNDPLVTYTGDANENAVLDVEVVNDRGRLLVISSESNFSEDPAPVEGCGDEPRTGSTGSIKVFDPSTNTFIFPSAFRGPRPPDCFPGGDILGLDADPFFDMGDIFGSGLMTVNGSLDGLVIKIDLDNLFAAGGGADLEFEKSRLFKQKKSSPGSLQVFVLTVRNKGPDTASNVRVTDSLPPGFTVDGIESFGGSCTQAGGEIMCDLGSIAPGKAKTIKISGRTPGTVGDYINTALATADNLTGPTRIASAGLQVRPFVPLSLTKTVVSSDSSRVEYRIEVQNLSEDRDATNVKMDDTLPPELFGVEFETSRGNCNLNAASPFVAAAKSTLNCTLDVLPPRDMWVTRVHGRPKDLRAQIFNRATVDADQAGTFDSDSATVNKTDGAAAADLEVLLWNFGAPGDADPMCRSLAANVFNRGPDDAAGVRLEIDQISAANLKTIDPLCSASGTRLNCDVGGLAALSSREMRFVVCAENEPENARFRGVVTAITADPDPTNDLDRAAAALDPSVENVRIAAGGFTSSSGFHRPLFLSAGSDPSLFGEGFGDQVIVADTVPLPLELGGVSVELNGIPAPLIFVSPNQINFQTPWELQNDTKAGVVVRNNGEVSLPAKVLIAPFNPGIFAINQMGFGQASVLIANTASLAAPAGRVKRSRPVKIGEFISIFATGLGAVDNRPPTGAVTPRSPLARTKTKPVVAIGGVNAPVSFSGLAPDFVGLYQVNAKVAEGTPVGDAVDLLLSSGEVPSNAVTIAVASQ